jgi:hypothetical protein
LPKPRGELAGSREPTTRHNDKKPKHRTVSNDNPHGCGPPRGCG